MNKRFALSAAAIFVVSMLLGMVVHGTLLSADYIKLTPNVFRTGEDGAQHFGYMIVAHVIMAIGFTWIYRQGRDERPCSRKLHSRASENHDAGDARRVRSGDDRRSVGNRDENQPVVSQPGQARLAVLRQRVSRCLLGEHCHRVAAGESRAWAAALAVTGHGIRGVTGRGIR